MTPAPLDLLFAPLLVLLALLLLFSANLLRSIVFFMVYGLLMALAWVRLGALDLALAEAAVGAGVTGILLLAAWRQLGPDDREDKAADLEDWPWMLTSGVLLSGLAGVLIWVVVGLDGDADKGLQVLVDQQLESSGVSSPVTAVLLNFRAYDTLLEIAVLLLAAILSQAMATTRVLPYSPPGPVLLSFVGWLIPLLVLAAGYLLWRGGHAPGGAFQAGALLAGAGILRLLACPGDSQWLTGPFYRALMVLGLLCFLAVAALTFFQRGLLAYPPDHAGGLILLIETAASISIAAALVGLFLGVMGVTGQQQEKRT